MRGKYMQSRDDPARSSVLCRNRTSPMHRFRLITCLVLALVWSVGCTPERKGAAPAAQVKGTVHLDGKPLPTGEIHFETAGYPPRVLQVKDGNFSGEAPVG